jgi:hypothetical protein
MAGETADEVDVAVVVRDADYFFEHQEEFEALSEEDKTLLVTQGFVEGDTKVEDPAQAEDNPAEEEAAAPDAAAKEEVKDEVKDEPVVLTADGKHTIPFSELKSARDDADRLRQQVADQQKLLDSLQAAKDADAETGGTQAQDDVMASLKENFPELADALGPIMQSMIDAGVNQRVSALEAKFKAELAPLQKSAEETAVEAHMNSIRAAHPDFETILEGDALNKWVETQPSIVRGAYQAVLDKGTAPQVIELFTAYKTATQAKPEPEQVQVDPKAAAKEAVDKAKPRAPVSLSDVPAGSQAHHDEAEAILEMNPVNMMEKFNGKTQAQTLELLNRII